MKRIIISVLCALCFAHVQVSGEDPTAFSMAEMRNQLIRESKCLEKENLTMAEVESFATGGNPEEAESNPALNCFAACLFEHSGIMSNCNVNEDIFADDELLENVHTLLTMCKGAVDAGDRCECAHQMMKCMNEKMLPKKADN